MIQKAEPRGKRYTLFDEMPGLMLRVEPSGNKIFYVDFVKDAKRSSRKLGSADILTVAQAREAAKEFLARVALGVDVGKKESGPTLGEVLEEHYFPWVSANRKGGEHTIARIKRCFKFLWNEEIRSIDSLRIEKWRVEKAKKHKAATINRDMGAFCAALFKTSLAYCKS
jgi:tartrate dehydratase beta subunit/fumarate hydratase class I family protein